jgi:hypothetical protein
VRGASAHEQSGDRRDHRDQHPTDCLHVFPISTGLVLQRVIAMRDATVTGVVADFSRYSGD